MSISKKTRFEVFKRDGFKCQYCGKTPPDIILEVDHINPVAGGGEDEINNLLCACFDCNRGKKNIPLERIPSTLQDNLEVLREKEIQLKEYNRFIQKIRKRIEKEMDDVNDVFESYYPGYSLNEKFIKVSLNRFFQSLPKIEIIEAMELACFRFQGDPNRENAIRYFCGICWRKIRGSNAKN